MGIQTPAGPATRKSTPSRQGSPSTTAATEPGSTNPWAISTLVVPAGTSRYSVSMRERTVAAESGAASEARAGSAAAANASTVSAVAGPGQGDRGRILITAPP